MKASELRIGNLLNINLPITEENKIINVSAYHIGKLQKMKDAYYPIQLTEDWFLKMPEAVNRYASTYFIKKLKFDVNNLGKIRFHFSGKVIYVDYLHQMQNIIFALTFEELKIIH